MESLEKGRGYYFGTVVDGKWWRRYREEGFFARGNGEYRLESGQFTFSKYLTGTPLTIPYRAIVAVETGRWHAGRWGGGLPVVKILWLKDGRRLSSGFLLDRDVEKSEEIVNRLKRAAAGSGGV